MKFVIIATALSLAGLTGFAQDTLRKKEITVTSTFKPMLKQAAKINITATPPTPDTSRPKLQYTIPNQNLSFAFQPGSLKPLTLATDTGGRWDNDSYIKVGYGMYKTPYIQAGLSVGDGKTMGLNVYAKHFSSKGKIKYQDLLHTNIGLNAFMQTANNIEWNASLNGLQEKYKRYGFEPKDLEFPMDSVHIKYQTWNGRLAFHNISRTKYGIAYAPEMKIDVLKDQAGNSESNSYINLPLEKTIGTEFEAKVAIEANLNQYKPDNKAKIKNTFVVLSPSLLYKTQNLFIQGGIKPSWDNGTLKLLPNVMAEVSTNDKRFAIQAGWLGYYRSSGFQYMTTMNPWVEIPERTYNSRIEERYAGLKGSISDHFSFGAKVARNSITNQPLFINDTITGKSFLVLNEPEIKSMNFTGELGYTVGEQFSLISQLTFNKYSTDVYDKAWGLIPLEWNTTMKVQILNDLYANANLYAFDGPWSYSKEGRKNLKGAMDLSAGFEFKVVDHVKIWTQFNNIFGKQYQRWNQYPVYGFNFLGGVVFSFAQKN